MRSRLRLAGPCLAAAAALAVLAACGSNDPADSAGGQADSAGGQAAGEQGAGGAGAPAGDPPGAASQAAEPGSMCAMVPAEQVASIFGEDFSASGFLSGKACRYDSGDRSLVLTVTQGGRTVGGKSLEDLPELGEQADLAEGYPDADGKTDRMIRVPGAKGWLVIGVSPKDRDFEPWRAKAIDLAKVAVKATGGT